ncbi:MAG: transposase [Elainellaceae cyanobacterium]
MGTLQTDASKRQPMKYDPKKHHRRSIRLKGYDYASAGAYFITICAYQRKRLFGQVVNGEMELNLIGRTARGHWMKLPKHHRHLHLDEFIIMPDHMHGILILDHGISGMDLPSSNAPGSKRHSLSEIIRGFKTFSTRRINQIRQTPGISVWQRNFYEHIIRDEIAMQNIRRYIQANPASWQRKSRRA